MNRLYLFGCWLLFAHCLLPTANCFAQLPDTDIWLLDIKDSSGKISFSNPRNITNRKGYDNQPVFSPDGKYILYTSQRDSGGPTDLYKYDLTTRQTTQFTKTPTSEYSPQFSPDGKGISVVMVEKDSVQRIWEFPLDGGKPACLMKNVKPVAYYCWVNNGNWTAVNLLTKPVPTLHLAEIPTQKTTLVADSIGRCLRVRDGSIWYTIRAGHFYNLFACSLKSLAPVNIGVIESEDYCFYGKTDVWSFSDNAIVSGYMNSRLGASELVNLEDFAIRKPSRLVVSPDGKQIAVVSGK